MSSGGATFQQAVQNHVKHLRLVLQRLREKQLAVSADKSTTFVEQVEFARHVVGYGIKRPILAKIACMKKWDKPRTVTELRPFIGFANYYYQEFVCLYAHHTAFLYSMLQVSNSAAQKGSDQATA